MASGSNVAIDFESSMPELPSLNLDVMDENLDEKLSMSNDVKERLL